MFVLIRVKKIIFIKIKKQHRIDVVIIYSNNISAFTEVLLPRIIWGFISNGYIMRMTFINSTCCNFHKTTILF